MAGRVVLSAAGWEARSSRLLNGLSHDDVRVGLYATEQEAQRVVDLLRIKAALDEHLPLEAVPLHLPIEEYAGNASTMQYLRDSPVDTLWDTFHACSAEQAVPDPALAAGATAAGPGAGAGPSAARGWWEEGTDDDEEGCRAGEEGGEQLPGLEVKEEEASDEAAGASTHMAVHGAAGASSPQGRAVEEQQRLQQQEDVTESEEGQSSSSEEEEEEEAAAAARQAKEQGTGKLNAAGRPLRVAAVRRKLPLPAPGEVGVTSPRAVKRQRTPPSTCSQQQQQQQQQLYQQQPQAQEGEEWHGQGRPTPDSGDGGDGVGEGGGTGVQYRRPVTKTIIFPPVPASMKCNKCVNCQNPQRKRPCVLARRRLLELLREQEQGLLAASDGADGGGNSGGGAGASGGGAGGGDGGSEAGDGAATTPVSPGGSKGVTSGRGHSAAAAVAAALHVPPRKQLYPIIPPSERCGTCKPCLNPRLKKACREARKRQLEAGLAPPHAQQAYDVRGLNGGTIGGAGPPRSGGGGGKARGEAAAAVAVAAGRQLGASLLGCRLRIYWPGMRRWYDGRVADFDHASGQHQIDYDDGDQQLHLLAQEKYILLDPPAQLPLADGNDDGAHGNGGEQEAAGQQQGGTEDGGRGAPAAAGTPAAKRLRHAAAAGAHGGPVGGHESGGSSGAEEEGLGAQGLGAALAPTTPASAAGASLPGSKAAAAAAVAALPAALAACCAGPSGGGTAAVAAGVTSGLVGRFMAAFSCCMSEGQRQEHAAFLLPLLKAGCFEGVQACMQEVVALTHSLAAAAAAEPCSPPARTLAVPEQPQQQQQQQLEEAGVWQSGAEQQQQQQQAAGEQGQEQAAAARGKPALLAPNDLPETPAARPAGTKAWEPSSGGGFNRSELQYGKYGASQAGVAALPDSGVGGSAADSGPEAEPEHAMLAAC